MADVNGVPVLVMRGGGTKGAYFRAGDLPSDEGERDRLLLTLTGWPRGVDGVGGQVAVVVDAAADPLVADVGCLVLTARRDRPGVETARPCGGILAAVGAFAIERGLVSAASGSFSDVRVMPGPIGFPVTVRVPLHGGRPLYDGDTAISGVPGTSARFLIALAGLPTLPTGRLTDDLDGVPVTLIDNGRPVVLVPAAALGVTGYETPTRLEYDHGLRQRVDSLRLRARELAGAVPRMCLVAPPMQGGNLCTRTFGRERVHAGIGVRTAVGVGAAAALPGSVAAGLVKPAAPGVARDVLRLEHPSGFFDVVAEPGEGRSAIVSTARLLVDGQVMIRAR
ncbi:PrpF domain-containing protein [Actinoplanes sp. NPDC051851]|uniref:PrpF domain-containing protein n=1 Tax=Actinoplanes sp. NPDC051851 TaxID=3154753 RepID=UPI003432F855